MTFRRTISVDDNYMFYVTQSVVNGSDTAQRMAPYGLVARHGEPSDLKGFFILLSLAAGAITCGLATALVKPIHEAAAPIVGPLVGMATAAALSVVMILNNADNEVSGPGSAEATLGAPSFRR